VIIESTDLSGLSHQSLEEKILQAFIPLQILNNKYRKDLKKAYDIVEEYAEDLMNNKVYGAITDGPTWIFLMYEHNNMNVRVKVINEMSIDMKEYFKTLHEIVRFVVILCCELIYNKVNGLES